MKNGQIILLGVVATKEDSDLAYMQCNSVPSAFKVFNMLRTIAHPKRARRNQRPAIVAPQRRKDNDVVATGNKIARPAMVCWVAALMILSGV